MSSSADLGLQDTGALAAAEYGRLSDGWCSTSTAVDSFSFLILAFVCQSYPAFLLRPRIPPKLSSLFVGCRFLFFSVCTGPKRHRILRCVTPRPNSASEGESLVYLNIFVEGGPRYTGVQDATLSTRPVASSPTWNQRRS